MTNKSNVFVGREPQKKITIFQNKDGAVAMAFKGQYEAVVWWDRKRERSLMKGNSRGLFPQIPPSPLLSFGLLYSPPAAAAPDGDDAIGVEPLPE